MCTLTHTHTTMPYFWCAEARIFTDACHFLFLCHNLKICDTTPCCLVGKHLQVPILTIWNKFHTRHNSLVSILIKITNSGETLVTIAHWPLMHLWYLIQTYQLSGTNNLSIQGTEQLWVTKLAIALPCHNGHKLWKTPFINQTPYEQNGPE